MFRWIGIFFVLIFSTNLNAQWTVELTRDAAFYIRYDGATVVRAEYHAWGPEWKYADFKTAIGKNSNETWTIDGQIKELNLTIKGDIKHTPNQLVFKYNLSASKPSTNNIGGGFTFTVRRDSQVFGPNVPAPQISGSDWSWTPKPDQTIKFDFDGMKSDSYFERGSTKEIRSHFIPQNIDAGESTVTMTITLPEGTQRMDGVSKRYGEYDATKWLTKTIDWGSSPVDLSYLNDKPAGIHGFVKAEGDHFVFSDGTPIKFWGTNIAAYSIFNAENKSIEQQARRLAQLGFNLVRIHHHDSAEWSPSVFKKDADNTIELDDKNLERLDYWIKCLKDQGIYIWIDLHVGRPFRVGDKIDGFEELTKGKTGSKVEGLNYVNSSITERMKDFAKSYLTRTNRYTNLSIVDDPAVMAILITNENDLTNHFGNNLLPDKNRPFHAGLFNAMKKQIVANNLLDPTKAGQTWLPGPSKVVLNQIEYDWNKDFVDYLHKLGVKVPISTTSTWGANPLFSLPALTAGDIIDVHAYGQSESLSSNPKYDDMSSHWIAAAQIVDRPLTITEWNTEYPQKDRFTQPLFIAANAAFQGWDAPMVYAYQQAPLVPQTKIDPFGIVNDPAHLSLMPAAALMYRTQQVKPAEKTVVFAPGDDLINKSISPDNSSAIRTLAETHRLVIGLPVLAQLPWLKGTTAADVTNPNQIDADLSNGVIVSDTEELTRDFKNGVYTINAPQVQAAMGWIGGREFQLADVTFDIQTAKAAVSVSSMDGQPIATSKKMLVSFTAQTHFDSKQSVVSVEPVVGQIILNSDVDIQTISPTGKSIGTSSTGKTIELTGLSPTHWIILTRK